MLYSKVIRDPIHGYIHLDPFEEQIVNTKIFLRLKNIKQSATADQTYPAHHVDRFSHSLGVMELAGRIVSAAFNNTPHSLLHIFFKQCNNAFGTRLSRKNLKEIIIRLIRLAGLLHDIGHLPFSHLSERAIEPHAFELYAEDPDWKWFIDALEGKRPSLHEFATYKIIKDNEEIKYVFRNSDSKILSKLLLKLFNPKTEGVFQTFHGVISSDIDADRADYLLRDGQTSGIGFGEYDQMRLFESMVFYKDKYSGNFLIRPTTAALSSAETFLMERHKLHKWLYYHQRVVLTDLILSRLLRILLKFSSLSGHALSNLLPLDLFHYKKYINDDLPFDDIFIWAQLRKAYNSLKNYMASNDMSRLSLENRNKIQVTFSLLRILLFREKLTKAVWKNPTEYENLENEIRQSIYKTGRRDKELPELFILNLYAKLLPTDRLLINQRLEQILLSGDYFILETEKSDFQPYKITDTMTRVSSYCLVDKKSDSLIPITRLSPIVSNLSLSREKEMQLFVYVARFHPATETKWKRTMETVRLKIRLHLTELYQNRILILNIVP